MILRLTLLILLFTSTAHAFPLQQIPAGSTLRGHFIEDRLLQGFDAPLHSEGNFTIASEGIIWQITAPFASTMVLSKAGITQEVSGEKTMDLPATRIPFFDHLHRIISGMLAGNWQSLKTDFDVTTKGTNLHWQAKLIPHKADNPAIPITSMTVTGSQFVEHVIMTRKDKSTDTLTFSAQTISKTPLSPQEIAAFHMEAP